MLAFPQHLHASADNLFNALTHKASVRKNRPRSVNYSLRFRQSAQANHRLAHVERLPMHHAACRNTAAFPAPTSGIELVVIDLDTPRGSIEAAPSELSALHELAAHGVALAVATTSPLATAHKALANLHAPARIHVMSDAREHGAAHLDRADALARLCRKLGIFLANTAVIATSPHDVPLALEAGLVLAVADAGPACLALADAHVPARHAGGIQQCARLLQRRLPGA